MLHGPHTYQLTIWHRRYSSNFAPPATTPKLPKLYTIARSHRLVYVGITRTRMSARLGVGLRATGKHGYHGYKLVDGDYHLNVWSGSSGTRMEDLESIEAEVAFAWRLVSGQWPAAQNEIHFHQTNANQRKVAQKIIRAL